MAMARRCRRQSAPLRPGRRVPPLVAAALALACGLALLRGAAGAAIDVALDALRRGEQAVAAALCDEILALDPDHAEAWNVQGYINVHSGRLEAAEVAFARAMDLAPEHISYRTNRAQILSLLKRDDLAASILEDTAAVERRTSPNQTAARVALLIFELDRGDSGKGLTLLGEVAELGPMSQDVFHKVYSSLASHKHHLEALDLTAKQMRLVGTEDPRKCELSVYESFATGGLALWDAALEGARRALRDCDLPSSIAALAHQVSSAALITNKAILEGLEHAKQCLALTMIQTERAACLNLVASAQQELGYSDEQVAILRSIVDENPGAVDLRLNLAGALGNIGKFTEAVSIWETVAVDPGEFGLRARISLAMLSDAIIPACLGPVDCHRALREPIDAGLRALEMRLDENPVRLVMNVQSVSSVVAPPFFWSYHGVNEQSYMDRKAKALARAVPSLHHAGHPRGSANGMIEIGFVSRYWHENHPHGLLLQGVMRAMYRSGRFRVRIVALFHVLGVAKDLADAVGGEQNVIPIVGDFNSVREQIASLGLDVIVFADTVCDSIPHALTFSRLAPVQAAFWGNPVTTCSPEIDYFISGDWMEPGCAAVGCGTKHPAHYCEQLVLLPGRGISLEPLHISPDVQRLVVPAQPEACRRHGPVFSILQSTYKFHPAFYRTIKVIMTRVPEARLLLLEGRTQAWTDSLKARLQSILGSDIFGRTEFLPRVGTSNDFLALTAKSTIALQPFPYGGAKTSADNIALGIPTVVMRGAYLRGRMAAAHLDHIGLHELIADDADDFIAIATRLAEDCVHWSDIATRMRERAAQVFDDSDVEQAWIDLFSRAVSSHRRVAHPTADSHARASRLKERLRAEHAQAVAAAAEQGELERGLRVAEAAVALFPDEAALHADLGIVKHHAGKESEALRCFERANELEPNNVVTLNNIGISLEALGDMGGATRVYKRALALNPRDAMVLHHAANAERVQGRAEVAFALYLDFLGLSHLSREAQIQTGILGGFAIDRPALSRVRQKFGQGVASALDALSPDENTHQTVNGLTTLLDWHQFDLTQYPHELSDLSSPKAAVGEPVVLLTQLFRPTDADRWTELVAALRANVANPLVEHIELLCESNDCAEMIEEALPVGSHSRRKVSLELSVRRLNYGDAFAHLNERFPGRICVLANADIELDWTIGRAASWLAPANRVLALLRWEFVANLNQWRWRPRTDSQDTWVFRSPLTGIDLAKAREIELGRPRCDNRIAHVLRVAGKDLRNPSLDIRTLHHHHSNVRPPLRVNRAVVGSGSIVLLDLPIFPAAGLRHGMV